MRVRGLRVRGLRVRGLRVRGWRVAVDTGMRVVDSECAGGTGVEGVDGTFAEGWDPWVVGVGDGEREVGDQWFP